jgi:hypothetical protein
MLALILARKILVLDPFKAVEAISQSAAFIASTCSGERASAVATP